MTDPFNDDFKAFIEVFEPRLLQFIRSRVASDQESKDLAQDVWYSMFRSMERGSIIDNPEAWLYRAARNRVIDAYRKIHPDNFEEGVMEDLQSDESPFDDLDQSEFYDLLEMALDDLPENQRIVFIRNEIDDETLREIAESEGESIKTIISRKRYAVIKLRGALGQYYDEFFGD